ncbi:MAG: DUF2817 domain-containing protein [Candidatus Nanopelagicales bacterium]
MTPITIRRASLTATLAGGVVVCLGVVGAGVAASVPAPATSTSAGAASSTAAGQSSARTARSPKPITSRVIGRSVKGRKIVARLYGSKSASRVAVIIGSMHGNETGGVPIAKRLEQISPPRGTALWVIRNLNPDGTKLHRRQNAHGVDLNRNGRDHWRPYAGGREYYPGKRPASEPETRAYIRFLNSVDPDLVLVYHQASNAVDSYHQKNRGLTRGLASRMKLRVRSFACNGVCTGTLTGWFNTTHSGVALTVELPRPVSKKAVKRGARAARWASTYVPDR